LNKEGVVEYVYKSLSPEQLEGIAEIVLGRFPHRRKEFVDIEGITEDLGLRILPRQGGLQNFVGGFIPRDYRFVIVAEQYATIPATYRLIVGEELSHAILEFDLLNRPVSSRGGEGHTISAEVHKTIENDARYLSAAIICPKADFVPAFSIEMKGAPADDSKALRAAVDALAVRFRIHYLLVARRAKDLGLMSAEALTANFSSKLAF
jgi:hypothetical protein